MMDSLLARSSDLQALGYFGLIIVVSMLEYFAPKRAVGDILRKRWAGNIAVTILDTVIVRLMFPLLGVGLALLCAERSWGLFNNISIPLALEMALTLVLLDAAVFVQHFLLHHIAFLWRLHLTHHTDQEFDFTTGLRFHPLESITTTGAGLAVIIALGPAPIAVLVTQLAFSAAALVGHGNLRLPARLERVARYVFVTPDMHRVHHSADLGESLSNLGNLFSWWDKLFGTYVQQPKAGHDKMLIGLAGYRDQKHLTLRWMLTVPFLPLVTDSIPSQQRSGTDDSERKASIPFTG